MAKDFERKSFISTAFSTLKNSHKAEARFKMLPRATKDHSRRVAENLLAIGVMRRRTRLDDTTRLTQIGLLHHIKGSRGGRIKYLGQLTQEEQAMLLVADRIDKDVQKGKSHHEVLFPYNNNVGDNLVIPIIAATDVAIRRRDNNKEKAS